MRRSREVFLAIVLAVGPAATLALSGIGRAFGAGSSAPPTTEPVATTEPATTTHAPISADESCLPRETVAARTAVLGGTTEDDARWVAAFGIDERDIQMVCVSIAIEGERVVHVPLGGPFKAADDPSEMVVALLTAGFRDGPQWLVVRGTVTADAARVDVSFEGAAPVRAELATAGPEGGWLWYAVAIPRTGAWAPEVVATAYDADGRAIATGADAYHASPGGD